MGVRARGGAVVVTMLMLTALVPWRAEAIEPGTVVLDDEGQPAGISQQLDAAGNPVISYWGGPLDEAELRLVHCLDPACATAAPIVALDSAAGPLGAVETSIQLDASDRPVIGYHVGGGEFDLRVARCDDPTCSSSSITTVDAAGVVGANVAMVLDADGHPVMAYEARPVSPGPTYLRLARCSDPACTGPIAFERLDEVTSSQFGPSLALDAAGHPVIAYNTNDRDLVVVTCSDPVCAEPRTTATMADGDEFPVRPSLVLDALGNPVVAHQVSDAREQGVRVQRCVDPSCSAAPTVAMIDTVASFQLSLALTDDDRPVVAMKTPISIDEGNLRVATCDDPACDSVTLADIAGPHNSGYYPSLSLDGDDVPSIAYQANTDGWLMFTRCADPTCLTDRDDDGVADVDDNCVDVSNADQLDTDTDGIGDDCDPDDDGDGQADTDEVACGSDPLDPDSRSPDADTDGIPDCVDPDTTTAPPSSTSPPATVASTVAPTTVILPETGNSTMYLAAIAGAVLALGMLATRLGRR